MLSITVQAFILTLTIMLMIYVVHKSKLRLLATTIKAEESRTKLINAIKSVEPAIENLRERNFMLEQFVNEQKDKRVMCFIDENKVCDLCRERGACPFKNEGVSGK